MAIRTGWLAAVALLFCLQLVSGEDLTKFYGETFYGEKFYMDEFEPQSIDEAIARAGSRKVGRSTIDTSMGPDMKTEGMDMVVTEKQYRRLHTGVRGRDEGHTVATPWTDGIIPIKIVESDFDAEQLGRINKAMRNWEAVTCVQFRNATPTDTNYVTISSMNGCWAHLGMMGGAQKMSLSVKGCFWFQLLLDHHCLRPSKLIILGDVNFHFDNPASTDKGTVEHEFGHTLGMIHEHQRPQRDPYIKVDYFAAKAANVKDLTKYADGSDDKMGLDFDYTSVMHYGKTAFSGTGGPTIYTVDPKMSDVIGMTLLPSFIDAKFINLMYQCKDQCPREHQRRCEGECFLTKDCICFCPKDITPEHCIDQKDECADWAKKGECKINFGFMYDKCRKSCGICKTDSSVPRLPCVNARAQCDEWAARGECESNSYAMLKGCAKACGQCQEHIDYEEEARCVDRADNCTEFAANGDCGKNPRFGIKQCRKSCKFCMENMHDPKPLGGCRDVDSVCSYWAENGLCYKHFTWMSINCPKSCGQCNFTLPAGCTDDHKSCHDWAFRDECSNNPGAMLKICKLSCNQCPGINVPSVCMDFDLDCPKFAEMGECNFNKFWMHLNCQKSCGGCPVDGTTSTTKAVCKDWHERCDYWTKRDECTKNPTWMRKRCAQSCGLCGAGGSFLPTTTPAPGACADEKPYACPAWAAEGECSKNPRWMLIHCKKSCNQCGSGDTTPSHTTPRQTSPTPATCVDEDKLCSEWAARGDDSCHTSSYMKAKCRKSCGMCSDCADSHPQCARRAENGYCEKYPVRMHEECAKSCNFCHSGVVTSPECVDTGPYCEQWANAGFCSTRKDYMDRGCKRTCGKCGV